MALSKATGTSIYNWSFRAILATAGSEKTRTRFGFQSDLAEHPSPLLRASAGLRAVFMAFVAVSFLALAGCATKKLPSNANDLGLNGATPGTPQDFTINVGDRIFFETDSSVLTVTSRTVLDKQAQWLTQYANYPVTIEGHADERGTREYNLALGARRAAATREYLAARGIARNRIRTISFGKERPVAVCNDISCWSQNRRAVTLLSAPAS